MSEITQGLKSSGKEFLVKGALSMSANDVIYICLCYLMSSCTFFGGSVPFVLSAYGAAFTGGKWLLFMVASVVGLLGALSDWAVVHAGGGAHFHAFLLPARQLYAF